MGTSAVLLLSLLECILKHWKELKPQPLKNKDLTFIVLRFCCGIHLESLAGSLDFNSIFHLDLFCNKEGK